jgi:uncharacterized membrane protein YkvA (DUF1232 family)
MNPTERGHGRFQTTAEKAKNESQWEAEDSVRIKLNIDQHLRRTRISKHSTTQDLRQKVHELNILSVTVPEFQIDGQNLGDDQLLEALCSASDNNRVLHISVVECPPSSAAHTADESSRHETSSERDMSPDELAREELLALPGADLKRMLEAQDIDFSDCIEKSDYVQRLLDTEQHHTYSAPLPPWRELLETVTGPSDLSDKVAMIRERLPSYLKLPAITAVKPALQQMWRLLGDPAAAQASKLVVAGALLYVVMPFDFIPDFIPVIGLTDDIAVVTGAASYLGYELTKYAQQEGKEEEEQQEEEQQEKEEQEQEQEQEQDLEQEAEQEQHEADVEQQQQQQQQKQEEDGQEVQQPNLGDVVTGIVGVAEQAAAQIAVGAAVIAGVAGEKAATMAATAAPFAATMATSARLEMEKVEKALGETAATMAEAAEARAEARTSNAPQDPVEAAGVYLSSLGLEELTGIASALQIKLPANATQEEVAKAIADADSEEGAGQGQQEGGPMVSLRQLGENVMVGAVSGAVTTLGLVQGGIETTRRSLEGLASTMAAAPAVPARDSAGENGDTFRSF